MRRLLLFVSFCLALVAVSGAAGAQAHAKPARDDDNAAAAGHGAAQDKAAPAANAPPADAKVGDDPASAADRPEARGPQRIELGIRLEKLNKFEIGPGTFSAEFFLSFRCASEPCNPDFEITNGKVSGKPDKLVDQKLLKQYRVKADL